MAAIAMAWLAQPLAHLTHSARQMLQRRMPQPQPQSQSQPLQPPEVVWPRAGGEVGELVQVFQGLAQQGTREQMHKAMLDGQVQAVLDNASVGIVISRHGILEVVGRQACLMLGYTAGVLQGRPARALYASDADYDRIGDRVQAEFAAHGAVDGDVCFIRKDGSPVWARVQGRGVQPGEAAGGGTVWILEDITVAREAQAQHAWERMHDALTQLYNRTAFDEPLGALLAERTARPREPDARGEIPGDGVVLFLDLDHFTVVNDIAGHDAGDDVLRHVARLLESQVRQVGWAARLGGDEFAVVLPGCALARGQAVAEQLRASVQAWEPAYQGRSFTLGVSIGLVVLDASLQDVPSVLYAADMACYDAKRAGRNRVETRHASQVTASGRMALGPV
jgi:diguanylate cyclase (GGDEF)-like protein/PAS domain S-box-containing protein